jgi:hypothetical protein
MITIKLTEDELLRLKAVWYRRDQSTEQPVRLLDSVISSKLVNAVGDIPRDAHLDAVAPRRRSEPLYPRRQEEGRRAPSFTEMAGGCICHELAKVDRPCGRPGCGG